MYLNPPLLSIIVPTRNRIPFCISVIESILRIQDNRLELVVSDNSDSLDLKKFVENNITDRRLRYNYTNEAISSIDNFNAGMGLSTGEFVCFIGDDDGINPEIIEAANWAKNHNVDALSSKLTATYIWPDSNIPSTLFTKVIPGTLTIYPFDGKKVQPDLDKEIKKFLRRGGINYLKFNLPKVYHGLVRRECMEVIKNKTGSYFGGLSPDIHAAMNLSCITDKVVIIDYPLTIAGSCPVAEETHANEEQVKKVEDAPHYRNRKNYSWNDLIPRFYSGKTIWLESAISGLVEMKREDLLKNLDLIKFSAEAIFSYPKLTKQIVKYMKIGLKLQKKELTLCSLKLVFYLILNRIQLYVKKGWFRMILILGIQKISRIRSLNDMNNTTIALENYLTMNSKGILNILNK